MPRYFFHIKHIDGIIEDREGVELAGSGTTQTELRRFLTEVLIEEEWSSESVSVGEFHVTDAHRRILLVVPFN